VRPTTRCFRSVLKPGLYWYSGTRPSCEVGASKLVSAASRVVDVSGQELVSARPKEPRIVDLRITTALACVVIGTLFGAAWAFSLQYRFELEAGEALQGTGVIAMTYADLAATLLTAVGVILAVLSIVIAVVGVWGFKFGTEQAAKAAVRRVEEELRDDGLIAKLVQSHVDKILSAAQSGRDAPATPKEEDEKWGDKNKEAGDE